MATTATVLADIFIMFLAAKLAGELFERLKQPAVIGELLVGVILGPFALGWIGVPTAGMIEAFHGPAAADEALAAIYEVLAELGVIILLFLVGLETRLSDILRVGIRAGVVAVAVMLGLATLSAQIGLAAIIGAFLAGMVFAELREQYELEHRALPLYELLVPLFFVITGSRVDWRLFLDGSILGVALAVTGLAILGKLVGCGAGAWGLGWRSVAIVGVGMAPRGEVGLIVANVGKSLAAIPDSMFSTVVIMSVLTTLVVPPVLTLLYRGRPAMVAREPETTAEFAVPDGRLPGL